MGPLQNVSMYALQMIKKLQTEYIGSLTVKQSVTDAFNEHCQEWVKHTVWVDDCRSWYKNNETGRVNAVYPGSSLHYCEMIKTPRWEDYEIEYLPGSPGVKNMWAFMGMGTCRALVEKLDVSPYLTVENIDPVWMKAMNIDDSKVIEAKVERVKAENNGVQSTNEQTSGLETKNGADTNGPRDILGQGKSVGDQARIEDHV